MGTSSPTCTQPSRRANTCKVVPRGTVRNTTEPVGTSRMFAPWRVITLPTSVGGAGAAGTTPRCCSKVIPFTSAPASSYSRTAVGAVNGAVPRSAHGTDAGQPNAFVIPRAGAGLASTVSPARAVTSISWRGLWWYFLVFWSGFTQDLGYVSVRV